MDDQHLVLLGELKGSVAGMHSEQAEQRALLQSIDARLRTQEQRAAAAGALSGGVISVGMALLIEGVKGWMHRGGPSA